MKMLELDAMRRCRWESQDPNPGLWLHILCSVGLSLKRIDQELRPQPSHEPASLLSPGWPVAPRGPCGVLCSVEAPSPGHPLCHPLSSSVSSSEQELLWAVSPLMSPLVCHMLAIGDGGGGHM